MADVHSPEIRRKNMQANKSRDTKPEILVRSYLFKHGFRFRKNVKQLDGTPDIVLKKYKTIIDVRGCFWHGHEDCKDFKWPKDNASFWKEKINATKHRDRVNHSSLESQGWKAFVVWECEVKRNMERILNGIIQELNGEVEVY